MSEDDFDRYSHADVSKAMLSEEHGKLFINWVNDPKNILVISGAPGIGKTYICFALKNFFSSRFYSESRNKSVRYWNERELLQSLRKEMEQFSGDYLSNLKYKIDDYLVIYDDLGSSPVNPWRCEVNFELLDVRYSLKFPTVITTNLTRSEIERDYGKRYLSRLFAKENTIIECHQYIDLRGQGK